MGLLDFYISQMLAILLYSNFDIDVDFIWLHQNFLCHIPRWARDERLFVTPPHSYLCLWRMILGEYSANAFFPTIKDLAMTDDYGSYTRQKDNFYYWQGETNSAKGQHLQTKICQFFQSWLIPIGVAIDARMLYTNNHPWLTLFSADEQRKIVRLSNFFKQKHQHYQMLHDICIFQTTVLTMDDHAFKTFLNLQGNKMLQFFRELFENVFGSNTGRHILYEDLKFLVRSRVLTQSNMINTLELRPSSTARVQTLRDLIVQSIDRFYG
jgi:hypothetical protein